MSADDKTTAAVPTTPATPTQGAHHGPGDGPGPKEAIQAFVERLKKSGWFSTKALGIAVFLVVAIIVWRYVAGVRGGANAAEWVDLDRAASVEELRRIAERDPNSYTSRVAQLYLARHQLDEGLTRIKTTNTKEQQEAIEKLETARKSFQSLAESFAKDPIQRPECLWGLAKAEQGLIGVPKADSPLQSRGEVATAERYFDQVAEAAKGTPLGQAAAEQAALLKANATVITSLQTSLYKPFSMSGMPMDDIHRGLTPPGAPGTPGPGIPGLPGGPEMRLPIGPGPKEPPPTPPAKAETPPAKAETPTPPAKVETPPAKAETPVPPTPPAKK